jgi:hypothetical protein
VGRPRHIAVTIIESTTTKYLFITKGVSPIIRVTRDSATVIPNAKTGTSANAPRSREGPCGGAAGKFCQVAHGKVSQHGWSFEDSSTILRALAHTHSLRKEHMLQRLIQTIIVTILLSVFAIVAYAQGTKSDPLKPYTKCNAEGGMKIREVDRRPAKADPFREVKTEKGTEKVSVLDGYRVMFAFPNLPYYYANVKIEQSAADSYEQDKTILVNQLKLYTTTKELTKMIFSDKATLNGFEHYGLDRDKIDIGGSIGTHILFYDSDHLVVSIYFLNQSKAVFFNDRRFETIEEYRELRDKFLNSYSQCLKTVADTN